MRFRYLLILPFLLLCQLHSLAQKKESLSEMIEKAKKEIANDPDMDAKDKALLLRMMNSKAVKNGEKVAEAHADEIEQMMKRSEKLTSLPQPDAKRIASMPTQPLSKEQCRNYIKSLSTKIEKQLTPDENALVQSIIRQSGTRSTAMSSAAVALWYNKNPSAALFLALKAAQPDSILALNNVGAMLNQLGYEEKAVPLLQYALTKDAANSNVLDNLGRAYLGLGEKEKAKKILRSCVAMAPANPEANNMLGCLYEAEGNKSDAETHFKKSMEGAYNENAFQHLSQINPDFDIVPLVQKHYKAPEYFNQFAIQVPRECISVAESEAVRAEHDAFEKGLDILIGKYLELETSSNEKMEADIKAFQNAIATSLEQGKAVKVSIPPLFKLAGLMTIRLSQNYQEDKSRVQQEYENALKELINSFGQSAQKIEAEIKARERFGYMGEYGYGCLNCTELKKEECKELENLANQTQANAADLHTLFKNRYRRIALDYFDNYLYWSRFTAPNHAGADASFYKIVVSFLSELKYLSSSTPYPLYTGCKIQKSINLNTPDFPADKKPFCPVSISIPFLIGKMDFDCTSFSISGGEVVKGTYKKDFSSGQSTISIGAGVSVEAGAVSAGADESIYVTFNGDSQPSDVGLKWEASGEVSAGGISTSGSAGYTVSMNSGWDFTAGAFGQDVSL